MFRSNSILVGALVKVVVWALALETEEPFARNSIFFGLKHPGQYDFVFRILVLSPFSKKLSYELTFFEIYQSIFRKSMQLRMILNIS